MTTENTLREALCLLAGNDRPCVGAVRRAGPRQKAHLAVPRRGPPNLRGTCIGQCAFHV